MPDAKIKVLIIDDSRSVLDLLRYILNSDPQIEVIGTAENGILALKFLEKNTPDVITMDMDMPEMDGLETTRIIMETNPIPIVVVSASWSPSEVRKTYRATEVGAVGIINKPRGFGHPDHIRTALELINIVKAMSEVRLVKRWSKTSRSKEKLVPEERGLKQIKTAVRLVAIGASTGGPPVIQNILLRLPKDLPVPILLVQHISKGFLAGFIDWLIISTGHRIHVATNHAKAEPGRIYVAPDDFQLGISSNGIIELSENSPGNDYCPSVSHLFKCIAKSYGSNAMGILLTGMGKDGANELKLMRDQGAVTIAQDEESSVIYGMPGEAKRIGAAKFILPPVEIAAVVVNILKRHL
jgi:two-component system chemotaxis response regulator CheB